LIVLIFFKNRSEKGSKTNPAIDILREATCTSENKAVPSNAVMPLFIKINELPQIPAKASNKTQLNIFFDMLQR
jgi:hypothetical protein